MRSVIDKDQFTPFGLFIRQHCRPSEDGLCITNLDYVFEDFKYKRLQLCEEKSNGGSIGPGQGKTFKLVHQMATIAAPQLGYEYRGFFELRFPPHKDFPGPGMRLNGNQVTVEELVAHLNFEESFCEGYFPAESPTDKDRLFAAAPELLESLRSLVDLFKNRPVSPQVLLILQEARVAIARATGGDDETE